MPRDSWIGAQALPNLIDELVYQSLRVRAWVTSEVYVIVEDRERWIKTSTNVEAMGALARIVNIEPAHQRRFAFIVAAQKLETNGTLGFVSKRRFKSDERQIGKVDLHRVMQRRPTERISVAAVNEANDVELPDNSITRAHAEKEGRRSRSDLADILCCAGAWRDGDTAAQSTNQPMVEKRKRPQHDKEAGERNTPERSNYCL